MLITKNKYTSFIDNGFSWKKEEIQQEINKISIKKGEYASFEKVEMRHIIATVKPVALYRNIDLLRSNTFLKTPVVVAFYSSAWGEHGLNFLDMLASIQNTIKWVDSELLILSADSEYSIKKVLTERKLNLNIYHDKNNELAKRFGVYSETKPVWQYISGINTNACYLSAFVISETKTINFKHIYIEQSENWKNNLVSSISNKSVTNY